MTTKEFCNDDQKILEELIKRNPTIQSYSIDDKKICIQCYKIGNQDGYDEGYDCGYDDRYNEE
jgi:hypothetical protein